MVSHIYKFIKHHSSSLFSAIYVPSIVQRNQFFHLYEKCKSFESKVKNRQANNCCKRVFEATKITYSIKQKSPSLPRNMALGTFGELLTVFLAKVNLLYLHYSKVQRCCLLHQRKQSELSYILGELQNMCLKGCCFENCWKVLLVVLEFKKVRERSTAKRYPLIFFLWFVKPLKKLYINNSLVDHIDKLDLYQYDKHIQYGFNF